MNFVLKKSDLNFKVYTVPSKPTAPGAANDIAIISSVPMTNWLMSPEKPFGIPRNDGDVWIQYSTTKGDIKNILKQNAMMIATISAWQYVDGAWVDVTAVSCQGGEWVDWVVYLYKNGNEYTNITGGWTYKSAGGMSCQFAKDGIVFTQTATSNQHASAYPVNKIDLTNVNRIVINITEVQPTTSNADFSIFVHPTEPEALFGGNFWFEHFIRSRVVGEVSLDVSAYSGKYYVGVNSYAMVGKINPIRLE